MQKLEGKLRAYPWGSHTLLAELRGLETPAATPEAELWFGAHPSAPSTIGGVGLDEIIAADPDAALGPRVREIFGDRLPFLLKLLAADEPLSIQAHPSAEQASEGFRRENAAGVPSDSPRRNYRDDHHKPELLVALTEFHALVGFRPYEKTRQLFDALACPALDHYAAMIDPTREEASLRALFTTWISIPSAQRETLVAEVSDCARPLAADQTWIGRTARNFLSIVEQYPKDAGVLAVLLLNHVAMVPGQALFIAAGQLHAYLRGMGVEIMANSDNVLRGGLTPKHVDVPELVRILDFGPLEEPFASSVDDGDARRFEAPCADFVLRRHTLAAGREHSFASDGPAILLCTSGSCACGAAIELSPGEAAWIPASEPAVAVAAGSEGCEVFYATA
ncbi:mannose-6-phosphate isomerase, class I [Corynebacterium timonense]|uniref:mannose-6-phosphate isomerase n=1 Tax=Corynebacterium timonense TaxID=441500 RepID=A0A1H1RS86_9CORY|nr:mannose-6-phosphate isomerase, class I [Corynebacterium timonense]SDS38578.1 mannose-6-phosphate isomerase, type 1 [Corynebacterium timonense]